MKVWVLEFNSLKHIERCKTLMHLIDITNENIENTYQQVKKELGKL